MKHLKLVPKTLFSREKSSISATLGTTLTLGNSAFCALTQIPLTVPALLKSSRVPAVVIQQDLPWNF